MGRAIKGEVSTPTNPNGSKLMLWIRDVALVYQGDDCLPWPFARNPTGYAATGRRGKTIYIHRLICEEVNGPPPEPRYQAAHSCGKGHEGCVNPRHLSWKTPGENQAEGPNHPRYKLTPQIATAIRHLKDRMKPHEIAECFGVTEATVRKVQAGQTWKYGVRDVGQFKRPDYYPNQPKSPQ
jgi:hypothetical protein